MFFKLIFISILWTSLSYGQSNNYDRPEKTPEETQVILPEEARVIHIPQIDNYPIPLPSFSSDEKTKEFVVRTQLNIAKIIRKHPNHIYIAEAVSHTLTNNKVDFISYRDKGERVDKNVVEKNMRYDFYKKSYKDLTDKEKELLYEIGSIPLLFFLGHIDKVYSPSTSPEKFEKLMDKTNAAGTDLLDHNTYSLNASARESQLKEQVDILLEAHPNKKVFIAYGAGHYLSDVFNSKYFYKIPETFIYPLEHIESLHFAIGMLYHSTVRYHHLEKIQGTEGFSEEQTIQVIDGFQVASDILRGYTNGKKPSEISTYYDPRKNKYLTVEELLEKANEASDFEKRTLEKHSHYKSCQSAFATN